MVKPVIGITASLHVNLNDGLFSGNERNYVNGDYVKGVMTAGGVPMLLPALEDVEAVHRQAAVLDGLLLSGGHDLDPSQYGEEPEWELDMIVPEQDVYELQLIHILRQMGKPILGICRGAQLINVAYGGNLYQDLRSTAKIKHCQISRKHVAGHNVELVIGSKLYQVMGTKEVRVNSFHHQSVRDLGKGLIVNAWAGDGIVEGVESEAESVLGVQWHPEMMFEKQPIMTNLFRWLVDTAGKNEAGKKHGG